MNHKSLHLLCQLSRLDLELPLERFQVLLDLRRRRLRQLLPQHCDVPVARGLFNVIYIVLPIHIRILIPIIGRWRPSNIRGRNVGFWSADLVVLSSTGMRPRPPTRALALHRARVVEAGVRPVATRTCDPHYARSAYWNSEVGSPIVGSQVRNALEGRFAFDEFLEDVRALKRGIWSSRLFDRGDKCTLRGRNGALEELQNQLHPSLV